MTAADITHAYFAIAEVMITWKGRGELKGENRAAEAGLSC